MISNMRVMSYRLCLCCYDFSNWLLKQFKRCDIFYFIFLFYWLSSLFLSFSPGNRHCDVNADIVFLFDDSASIIANHPNNFKLMKDFMKEIVGKFTFVGPAGAQFGAVCFAHDVRKHFFLNKYNSGNDVKLGIEGMVTVSGSSTRIGLGLEVMLQF